MNEKQATWYANRISGSIAEACCRVHFEALGYAVESFGIEHVAPRYAALTAVSNAGLGNYARSLQPHLHALPDFLVSREYPDTEITNSKRLAGKVDALLVEAKFRQRANASELCDEFYRRYASHIDAGMNVLVYLVSPYLTVPRQRNNEVIADSWVHLCLFSNTVFGNKDNFTAGFLNAGDPRLDAYPVYDSIHTGENFNSIYNSIVQPSLRTLFSINVVERSAT